MTTWPESMSFPMISYTGKEVMASGVNGVLLSTIRSSSMATSVIGIMTTGDLAYGISSNNGSTSSVSETKDNYYSFRNTPDSIAVTCKELSATSNITGWRLRFYTMDGTSAPSDATKTIITKTIVPKYIKSLMCFLLI